MNSSASWLSPQAASSTSRGATRRSTSAHCAISSSNSLLMSTGPPVRAATWMVRLEPSGKVRKPSRSRPVRPTSSSRRAALFRIVLGPQPLPLRLVEAGGGVDGGRGGPAQAQEVHLVQLVAVGSTRSSHFMSSITNIRSSTMNGSPLDHLVPGRSSRVTVRPSSATA